MKVLQINVTINSGSTGRIAEQLGERILKKGYESNIAYSRKTNPSTSSIVKIGHEVDFYWHILTTRFFDNHGFSSKNATKQFLKKIEQIDPDVIHLHNLHGYYIHVGLLIDYLVALNRPVIWTFHDCWPFTGHCAYFDRVNCEKWKDECHKCPLQSYYPASWFLDNSKKNFNKKKFHFTKLNNLTIVTPSNWLKDIVKESFFKNDKVKVIHNGIDLSVFKFTISNMKTTYNLTDKIVLLGVASIWDSRKGLNDFVKLSMQLSIDYKIILVGVTKKQIAELPPSIVGIERTENLEELAAIYSAATIYLNPTYSDNFPTTNIEALACGTPVITYATGGSPEAIDITTGITVEKGDISGIVDAVAHILDDTTSFSRESCRKRAETLFNKNDRYDDYINLYKEVIV